MCEECKSTQWSKNWPYLWLMAWGISPGIFGNRPVYWWLPSAFVTIMLPTLGDDYQKKTTPHSDLQKRKDKFCHLTHTHTFVGFIHFRPRAYLMTELGLKMGCKVFFFFLLHIKIEKQLLTDCTYLQNVLMYHNQLQGNAQYSVYMLVQQT